MLDTDKSFNLEVLISEEGRRLTFAELKKRGGFNLAK